MPDVPDRSVATLSDNGGDDDDDSLFGSPPSSPARGRSPSPLALPGGPGSAQNVGALALPGSHLVAELPTDPPASLPLSASASAPTRQSSVPRAQPSLRSFSCASSSRTSTPGPSRQSRPESTVRKSRKGKAKANSTTPRPTPPPIPLPSPDEPPPPNFLRNQQALLGLAGMVGGVNPANLSKTRQTRGTTVDNPIVVEEEQEIPPQPSIGKRPTYPSPSDPSQLPRPTSEQILATLLKQKNIFPVVVSLLRLLAPHAPSLAPVPPGYPHYSYPYYYPMPVSQPQSRGQTPSQSSGSESRPSSSSGAPPLKRRKLNSVPAGAADWDVPYPFEEGQGPENYRAQWEQARGKQLLKDLVQLVQNAARKAATKAWYRQQVQQRYATPTPSALKYYRPATLYYGLERGQSAPPPSSQVQAHISANRSRTPGTTQSAPHAGVHHARGGGGLPHAPAAFPAAPDGRGQYPQNAFDQLVESLLAAQQQQQQRQQQHEQHGQPQDRQRSPGSAPPSRGQPSSAPQHPTSFPVDPPAAGPSSALYENTQAFFDSWLEMLTTFPPGDPNDTSVGTNSPASANGTDTTKTSVPPSDPSLLTSAPDATMTAPTGFPAAISDDMIDPALLDMQMQLELPESIHSGTASTAGSVGDSARNWGPTKTLTLDTHSNTSPSDAVLAPSTSVPGPSSTSPTAVQPPTPSLVDSPSVTASSLADPTDCDHDRDRAPEGGREADAVADAGPTTPSWEWSFPDAQEAAAAAEGMKYGELAGMDVDVDLDAVMRDALGGYGWDGVGGVQSIQTAPGGAHGVDVAGKGRVQATLEGAGETAEEVRARLGKETCAQGDGASGPLSGQNESLAPALAADLRSSDPGSSSHPATLANPSRPPAHLTHGTSAPTGSASPSLASAPASTGSATPTSVPHVAGAVFGGVPAPVAAPTRAKGKAKATPGTGNGVGVGVVLGSGDGTGSATGTGTGTGTGKSSRAQERRAVLERARRLRAALAREVERAKVALWETTLEQGVLVGLGRELEKGDGGDAY